MGIGTIWHYIRNYLFSKFNRELLIFLFFLFLSGVFWLSLTLNETYEQEFAIPVTITDVPKNAVLTSDEVDTVRMTIRDKGIVLAAYHYGDYLRNIQFSFRNYTRNNGTGLIAAQDIQKTIYQHMLSSSKIVSMKPEKLEFYYNYGTKKQVPVRWNGRVIPEELYFISLDSINMVYTEPLNYANFRDTLIVNCHLSKLRGVKMVPDHIQVSFFTDVLTEERIEGIPIEGINMPEGKVLRTFPAKVSVTFVTGVSVYRNLRPENFTVVADYQEIKQNPSEKCRIYLKDVPAGISRAKLETTMVDYLIETE